MSAAHLTLLVGVLPSFAGSVTKKTTESPLGVASKLEIWWRGTDRAKGGGTGSGSGG